MQQVMKFAELTQEVRVTRPQQVRFDTGLTPGRRKLNMRYKEAVSKAQESGGRFEALVKEFLSISSFCFKNFCMRFFLETHELMDHKQSPSCPFNIHISVIDWNKFSENVLKLSSICDHKSDLTQASYLLFGTEDPGLVPEPIVYSLGPAFPSLEVCVHLFWSYVCLFYCFAWGWDNQRKGSWMGFLFFYKFVYLNYLKIDQEMPCYVG